MKYKKIFFVFIVFLFASCNQFKEQNTLRLTIEVGDCSNATAKPEFKAFADILVKRLNNMGYPKRNIMIKEEAGRLYLTLNNVDDVARIRKNIQSSGRLDMCETYENKDIGDMFTSINRMLQVKADTVHGNNVAPAPVAGSLEALMDSAAQSRQAVKVADGGSDTSAQSRQLLEEYERANPLFALLRPSIGQNENGEYFYLPGPVVGYSEIKDTARVNAILGRREVRALLPNNLRLIWCDKPLVYDQPVIQLVAVKISGFSIDGSYITEAKQTFTSFNDAPEISITMNAEGAEHWRRMTAANKGRSIAMLIDNRVYSFPTVTGEIPNGRSSITGNFTVNEAKDMAAMLDMPYLPCKLRIVEESLEGVISNKDF